MHRLALEEGVGGQGLGPRGTGLLPLFLGFPAQPVGSLRQGEAIAAITAIHQHLQGHPDRFALALDLHGLKAIGAPRDRAQLHIGPPAQSRFLKAPLPQKRFGGGWGIAKAAHPVLVQALGFTPLQLPQKGAPQPCLPGGEFVAIGTAHPRRAHHAAQPGPGRQQQGVGTTAGGLQGGSHTAGASPPHHHLGLRAVARHGPACTCVATQAARGSAA